MIKMLQLSVVDLLLLEQDHMLIRKEKEKNMALWKQTKQCIKVFAKVLLVTNFPFNFGLDYKKKQLSKEFLQFAKVFAIYFIFRNNRM